ncbi:MAG TPA: DMT family transporter [Dysgonamonadaceae bacterium]|nr:DMT family transporter [Dysgonamonadaceae bacterium]HQI43298.1 DMT family transporter [Dysgonamonadaceae bacterium]
MKDNNKAILYVSITVLSWATVASAFKLALSSLTYYELLLIASFTALIAFAIILTFRKRWFLLRSVNKGQWRMFAIAGMLNPTMYYLVLFKSYELLPAQIAQPINYMWPVVLSVMLAIFARQRIPAFKFAGMAISLAGVAVISVGPGQLTGVGLSVLGLTLGIGSAFVWATYWLINRMNAETDQIMSLFFNFFFGTIYLLMIAPFMKIEISSLQGVLAAVYSGLFEMTIPFIFFGIALKKTDNPALINHLCYLSPFLSLFIIHLILGESIYSTTYTGLALIVGGLLFNEYIGKRMGKKI